MLWIKMSMNGIGLIWILLGGGIAFFWFLANCHLCTANLTFRLQPSQLNSNLSPIMMLGRERNEREDREVEKTSELQAFIVKEYYVFSFNKLKEYHYQSVWSASPQSYFVLMKVFVYGFSCTRTLPQLNYQIYLLAFAARDLLSGNLSVLLLFPHS